MIIDVLSLSRTLGESIAVKFEADASKLLLSDELSDSIEKIDFEGSLACVETGVFQLVGKLTVVRTGLCDRCLVAAKQEYEVMVDEHYRRSAGSDDTDEAGYYYGYAGRTIDTDQAIRDNLLLDMPGQLLCREQCPGFCPECGRDLNEGPCNCQAEPAAGSPFAKLSKLLQDDEDVLRT